MKENTTDIKRYINQYQRSVEILQPFHERGDENARYYMGNNWSDADKRAHINQGFFHAYSIPLIAVKLNRILSIQRDNRFDARARGRGEEDELTAESINYIIKYTDDVNGFKWIESEIYQDGLTKLFGVLKVDIDTTYHPKGEISLSKTPFKQFYYDTNATDYLLKDATFMGEYKWITLDSAKVLYPDFDFETKSETSFFDNFVKRINFNKNVPRLTDWVNEKKKLIKICEHYDGGYKQKYLVKNFKTGDFHPFSSKREAENFIGVQIKQEAVTMARAEEYSKLFTEEDFAVIPKMMPVWNKIIFTGEEVISEEPHKYSKPPYFRYCSLFDDGDFWTLTDLAKDPQKAYDRIMSMIDKSTAKNIKGNNYTIHIDRLHPSETKDLGLLEKQLSSGGKLVGVVGENVIQPIQRNNDVRIESNLATAYQSLVEDLLGGRSFQGLDSPTRQTATEVVSLEKNASQTGLLFVDNLARWKQGVFEYVVELIKDVYTPDRTVRVIGEVTSERIRKTFIESGIYKPSSLYTGEVGYLSLNKLPKPIHTCELDIVIDNVQSSKLDKDEKFQQIMALNQMAVQYGYPPMPFEILLQYSKLDPTIKKQLSDYQEKAQAEINKQKEMQGDMAKMEMLNKITQTVKPPEVSAEQQSQQQPKTLIT